MAWFLAQTKCNSDAGRHQTVMSLTGGGGTEQRSSLCAVPTYKYGVWVGVLKARLYFGWLRLAKSL